MPDFARLLYLLESVGTRAGWDKSGCIYYLLLNAEIGAGTSQVGSSPEGTSKARAGSRSDRVASGIALRQLLLMSVKVKTWGWLV